VTRRSSSSWDGDGADIAEGFVVEEVIGRGATAMVFRARSQDGRQVALKHLAMRAEDEDRISIARKEYETLCSVKHPNIIGVEGFQVGPHGVVLVLEYFKGSTLTSLASGSAFAEGAAKTLFWQLAGAVAHLHSLLIVHRDVKADNVLVSQDLLDLRLVERLIVVFELQCCKFLAWRLCQLQQKTQCHDREPN